MGISRRAGTRRSRRAATGYCPLRRHLGGAQDRRGGGSLLCRNRAAQPLLLVADHGQRSTRFRHAKLSHSGISYRSPAGGGTLFCAAVLLARRRLGGTADDAGVGRGTGLGRRARPRATALSQDLPAVAVARGRVRGRLVTGYRTLAVGCEHSAEWLCSGD